MCAAVCKLPAGSRVRVWRKVAMDREAPNALVKFKWGRSPPCYLCAPACVRQTSFSLTPCPPSPPVHTLISSFFFFLFSGVCLLVLALRHLLLSLTMCIPRVTTRSSAFILEVRRGRQLPRQRS